MKANGAKRILFFINDFKTDLWGAELTKYNYEVVNRDQRFFSHIKIIVNGFFRKNRVHAFIFRYLNDHKSLYESSLYLLRDILIISLCKLLRVKILWILHNIDRETVQNYPLMILLRRKFVHLASKKVLVTDPNLFQVAAEYGIKEKKIDWLCFGRPTREQADQKNIDLKRQISSFKNRLENNGEKKVYLGLCVSKPAKKKLHYLMADSIVGATRSDTAIVGLVMMGDFPEGQEYEDAKQRIKESPHILFIDDSFKVNEAYISNQIGFFYRSLIDQSVPFTLYISAHLKKPIVTHDYGSLPLLIKKEKLGVILDSNEKDIPGKIAGHVDLWSPKGADEFLKNRTWDIAAQQLIKAIEE